MEHFQSLSDGKFSFSTVCECVFVCVSGLMAVGNEQSWAGTKVKVSRGRYGETQTRMYTHSDTHEVDSTTDLKSVMHTELEQRYEQVKSNLLHNVERTEFDIIIESFQASN